MPTAPAFGLHARPIVPVAFTRHATMEFVRNVDPFSLAFGDRRGRRYDVENIARHKPPRRLIRQTLDSFAPTAEKTPRSVGRKSWICNETYAPTRMNFLE